MAGAAAGDGCTRRTEVVVVAHGRPATEALAARVAAAKAHHPLDTVTVVVPSNLAGLSARRLLGGGLVGSGAGIANANFVTPYRLAELLGGGELGPRRPLTNPVLAAAVRAALAHRPGPFAAVAGHEATQAALVATYAELSRALPETLERIAAGSGRGADVVGLVRAVRQRLAGYYDEDELADAASARLRRDPSAAASLGTVVWHLPDRLTPAMARLLGRVLEAAPSAAVVGLTGDPDADAVVRRACADAGLLVAEHAEHAEHAGHAVGGGPSLQLHLALSPPAPAGEVGVPHAHRVVSASDPDEEVRAAVREVVARAEAGTPLDRIGIFHPAVEPYARTLAEHLDGAGVARNGPGTARLADAVAGRTLLAALALSHDGWGRGHVLALVAGGPVRHGDAPAAPSRWDAVSRAAGVVGGLHDWQAKLTAHAAALREDARGRVARAVEGEDVERAVRARLVDAEAAEALLRFVECLAAAVDAVEQGGSWRERGEAARRLLAQLLGPEHGRTGWPEAEADAADRVDAALARLATLDEVDPSATAATFRLAVTAELDTPAGRVGRFGHGVLVAPLAAAVGLDLDAVLVLGLAEGACPVFPNDDVLVPDHQRQLAVAGELVTRQQRLHDQHRAYLAALAAGRAHRTLFFPRGDLRGRRARLASRWLLDTASHLAGRTVYSSDVSGLDASVVSSIASYVHGVAGAATHGSLVDRDVAALLAHTAAGGDVARHPLAAGPLGRGLTARAARASEAFTEWDGNLAGHTVPSPATGIAVSPSRLETWAGCGFKYYLAYVLRLADRDEPERIDDIGLAERGSLVHEVLERFIGETVTGPGGPPAPTERWSPDDRRRLHQHAAAVFARYEAEGKVGRPLAWRRAQAQILADLDTFLDHDDAFRAGDGARPVGVEVRFGLDEEPPLRLELPDGRELSFRGVIDRVDRTDDGRLVVHDYKTGKDRYAALDDDPVLAGTSLQLGIYAEAAADRYGGTGVDAHYWMASTRGQFRRPGYRWDEGRRHRLLDVVSAVADGIESGTFPARPGEYDAYWGRHANCSFCDFDAVCPRDRDDHERAKAAAPELKVLERLQPPAAGDGEDEEGGG